MKSSHAGVVSTVIPLAICLLLAFPAQGEEVDDGGAGAGTVAGEGLSAEEEMARARALAVDDYTKEEMIEEIIELVDLYEDITRFVREIRVERAESGDVISVHYVDAAGGLKPLTAVDKESLHFLMQKMQRHATLLQHDQIQRQLDLVSQVYRLQNSARNTQNIAGPPRQPQIPRPPQPPPAQQPPRIPRTPTPPPTPRR
ncbi:MAG: hypothetical protein ABIJ27_08480 [Candidatus Omnitrophota bacterium]